MPVPASGVSSPRRGGLAPLPSHLHPVPACHCCGSRQRGLAAGPVRHVELPCMRFQPSAQPSRLAYSQQHRGARLVAHGFGDDLLDFINGPLITCCIVTDLLT